MSFKELKNVIFAITLSMQVQNNYPNWLVKHANTNSTVHVFRNGFILVISLNVHYVKANFCDLFIFYLILYIHYLFYFSY
jgi:hypothetical protein